MSSKRGGSDTQQQAETAEAMEGQQLMERRCMFVVDRLWNIFGVVVVLRVGGRGGYSKLRLLSAKGQIQPKEERPDPPSFDEQGRHTDHGYYYLYTSIYLSHDIIIGLLGDINMA